MAMTIEEMLTGRRFVRPLPMSHYSGEYGERELADLLAARARIRGTPRLAQASTGLSGRSLEAFGEQAGARAAAAGQLRSRARSGRDKEYARDAYKRQLEETAAENAAKLAQHKLKMQVLGSIGGVTQDVIGAGTALGKIAKKDIEYSNELKREHAANFGRQVAAQSGLADVEMDYLALKQADLASKGLAAPDPFKPAFEFTPGSYEGALSSGSTPYGVDLTTPDYFNQNTYSLDPTPVVAPTGPTGPGFSYSGALSTPSLTYGG